MNNDGIVKTVEKKESYWVIWSVLICSGLLLVLTLICLPFGFLFDYSGMSYSLAIVIAALFKFTTKPSLTFWIVPWLLQFVLLSGLSFCSFKLAMSKKRQKMNTIYSVVVYIIALMYTSLGWPSGLFLSDLMAIVSKVMGLSVVCFFVVRSIDEGGYRKAEKEYRKKAMKNVPVSKSNLSRLNQVCRTALLVLLAVVLVVCTVLSLASYLQGVKGVKESVGYYADAYSTGAKLAFGTSKSPNGFHIDFFKGFIRTFFAYSLVEYSDGTLNYFVDCSGVSAIGEFVGVLGVLAVMVLTVFKKKENPHFPGIVCALVAANLDVSYFLVTVFYHPPLAFTVMNVASLLLASGLCLLARRKREKEYFNIIVSSSTDVSGCEQGENL